MSKSIVQFLTDDFPRLEHTIATMVVCANCHHKRSFHKKVDGNAWCTLEFCACKNYVEAEINFNRRALHRALDEFLDDMIKPTDEVERP